MSQAPTNPYQPYAAAHKDTKGPGDSRPTALQIIKDNEAAGKLKGKTILVTGCSSGIGIETARALYETGAQLFLTARDIPKLNGIIDDIVTKATIKDAPRPEVLELHLDSLESVRKGAEEFKKRSSQLNILICNAAVMACPYSTTKDGFELQIGTNHFAHFLLFQLLKPLLLESAQQSGMSSRVIAVSSAGHRMSPVLLDDINFSNGATYQKWKSYGQSKTANIYMASSIERHYGNQNLHALSLHPGVIKTDLSRHLVPEDLQGMNLDQIRHLYKNPEQGAATTVWAATSPHFEAANGGRYLAECGECGPVAKDSAMGADGYAEHVYNPEAEEKLWKLSYEAVGLPVED
ncbi:Hypothetical predicted protein [Lecanosticta acicola]|uniref:Short-chain dehydrogenase n=1 Tax=Lecanosticta acicola TaxID=111012 RepID=A0AAI8YRG8_9PEZI|nr:Hypothetical predicted protein [Lecanosticta acicola]